MEYIKNTVIDKAAQIKIILIVWGKVVEYTFIPKYCNVHLIILLLLRMIISAIEYVN